jgi:LAO/AO transport system kinase
VLERLLPRAGHGLRVGVTGVPGVGKSTLIEALGTHLTGRGHKLAVLAVDPSSERTGGSILGDKTRMPRLAADPRAFVRPSPASGALGGVARTTREALLLCEAAGHDVVLVETVGVGQSETIVAGMVDTFLVLVPPGGGDALQGIKKGIVELADLIAVTKADGDLKLAAEQAARHYADALHILAPQTPAWRPVVRLVSAVAGEGVAALWDTVMAHRAALAGAGDLALRRRRQSLSWFRAMLTDRLMAAALGDPALREAVAAAEADVAAGRGEPASAVDRVVTLWLEHGVGLR